MISMIQDNQYSGMTLLELLIAMSIIATLGIVCARVLAVATDSWNYGRQQNEARQNACWALDRIANRARSSNRLLLPLRADPNSPVDVLAFSAMVDTEGDGLIDEDPGDDISGDGASGISGIDDDGDGYVDEGRYDDDDEDSYYFGVWQRVDEDPVDGIDNDGDGLIDEDPWRDNNGDGQPGVDGKDDNGNGIIDEWVLSNSYEDDDEDGKINEDPVEYWLYYLDPNGNLMERYYTNGADVLVKGVTTFQVVRTESDNDRSGVYITLGITNHDGEEIILKTLIYLKREPDFAG